MSRTIVTPRFLHHSYTADTVVEIDSSGAIDPQAPAPPRNVTKFGVVVDKSTQGYRDAVFDPKREDEFIESQELLETVGDTMLGATDQGDDVSLPGNWERVPAAADNLLENRNAFIEKCPVGAALVDWDAVALERERLKKITRRKQFTEERLENLAIAEANLLVSLEHRLSVAFNSSASSIDSTRTLRSTFKPLSTMVRGAAEQAQATKRVVARALKKQGRKGITFIPVTDGAKDSNKDAPAAKDGPAKA